MYIEMKVEHSLESSTTCDSLKFNFLEAANAILTQENQLCLGRHQELMRIQLSMPTADISSRFYAVHDDGNRALRQFQIYHAITSSG